MFTSKTSTLRRLGLVAALGLLLPGSAAYAQSAADQAAYAQALKTSVQWAGSGFSAEDMRLSSAYADASGLEHAYMQQLYRGIPVYNRMATLAFRNGRLASHAGTFLPAKQLAALPASPSIGAAQAVRVAAQAVAPDHGADPALLRTAGGPEAQHTFSGAGVARRDIVASLVWGFDAAGRPRLAWNVNLELLHSADWWNVQVDAITGTVIGRDNWTVQETATDHHAAAATGVAGPRFARTAAAPQRNPYAAAYLPPSTATAAYLVVAYPRLSPSAGPLQIETDPWLKAGASNNATTHGWHFDGTLDYAYTRGNNVMAYDDAGNTNAPGNYANSQSTGTGLTFNYVPDFSTSPSAGDNRNAAVVNLFYWNNIIHDVTYQYGFTEAAGNFQRDNLSRGGRGEDHVRAEAQDGGGTNNANFSAPPDGTSGRMQMYLWRAATPPLQVTAPAAIAGSYTMVESGFSTANKLVNLGPISGQVATYVDGTATTNIACVPHGGAPLTGKIALITRGGTCGFAAKVKNAQTAGAIAAIVINNTGAAPGVMGGTDNTVTIPAVMISQADGALLTAQLANNVQVTLSRPSATAPQLDGDFDNGVVVHEYGHGVSIRLTGGPANSSCLSNAEQGGEGWSDYLSLMLNTDWSTAQFTDGPRPRAVGAYAAGQPLSGMGIRRYPYSTSMTVSPLTYADVAPTPAVHAIGEIWCAALWDMTWNIIQQQNRIEPNLYNANATGGNTVALQLVMQGMKLQPCQPGFLDARDAILKADSLLYQGRYQCAIWSAFARRGMGYNARQGASTSATDQTAGFDMPPPVTLQRTAAFMSGNTFDVTLAAQCNCQVPTTPYTLTDELPTGMQYVSSVGGTYANNKVTFSNVSFSSPGEVKTFRFRAQAATSGACPVAMPINDNQDGTTLGSFTSQALVGTTNWASSNVLAYSPTRSWNAPSPVTPVDFVLTSAPFTPTGLSTLSFYHYFNFEGSYDGGTVELSTDDGTTWTDAGQYLIANGYNSTFDASTTAPGQRCFSGRSVSGTANTFIRSLLDLNSFTGRSLRLRFRVRTDTGSPGNFEGWFIDDIQVLNGCGGNQRVELRDGANALAGSGTTLTYLLPAGVTAQQSMAQISQFSAQPNPFGAQGLRLALQLPTAQSKVELTLLDVTGRLVMRRTAAQVAAGASTVAWPEAAKLPAGLYLVRVSLTDGSSTTVRVVRE